MKGEVSRASPGPFLKFSLSLDFVFVSVLTRSSLGHILD